MMESSALRRSEVSIKIPESSMNRRNLCIKRYAQNLLTNPPALHQDSRRATVATGSTNRFLEKASLSSFGKQLNKFSDDLRVIEEPHKRDVALLGLTRIVTEIVENPWKVHMLDFMTFMNDFKGNNPVFFDEIFVVLGNLTKGGYNLDEWVNIFVKMTDKCSPTDFVEETGEVICDEEGDSQFTQEIFAYFLSTWRLGKPFIGVPKPVEKRKFHRKRVRLLGQCYKLDSLERCRIIVIDLSPEGLALEVFGKNILQESDLINTLFILDDYMKKEISKVAIVKHSNGVFTGAQFQNQSEADSS